MEKHVEKIVSSELACEKLKRNIFEEKIYWKKSQPQLDRRCKYIQPAWQRIDIFHLEKANNVISTFLASHLDLKTI